MATERTDPTGAAAMRPDAGVRTELHEYGVSEHATGGLLARGSRVRIGWLGAPPRDDSEQEGEVVTGEIVDWAGTPAAYLSIEGPLGRVVVFLGPGIIVTPA